MKNKGLITVGLALLFSGIGGTGYGVTFIQCPGEEGIPDAVQDVPVFDENANERDIQCIHLSGGDGFVTMADGRPLYLFSFADITGVEEEQAIDAGTLAANFSAPTLRMRQGQEVYLTLSNVGMQIRPDLFDPHTVHFHGFPNASDIFDGLPEATLSINQGASLTYYYQIQEPGTHMYHCHVEATEHMQMGMLGNLYVEPLQNVQGYGGDPTTVSNIARRDNGQPESLTAPEGYVYNDTDGATAYDVEVPIQIGSFDGDFHQASEDVQPLPFAEMVDRYPMLNGRGYPDSANPAEFNFPSTPGSGANAAKESTYGTGKLGTSQPVSSFISANQGEKILLRISNLNITNFYTLATNGLPMQVVGNGARILRGGGVASGQDLFIKPIPSRSVVVKPRTSLLIPVVWLPAFIFSIPRT
jgi:FtsP/CotA-like multicopper oxidase with cupredoxin domain